MTQGLALQDTAPFAPAQVVRVYGMRRSGNHAIVDWILRNAPNGAGLFLNNCKPNRDPIRTARGIALYDAGTEQPMDLARDKIAAAGQTPFTLVSYEDTMPALERMPLFEAPETCVIIYRSFLQWSASLLRKIQANSGYGPLERMRIMMQSMRTYAEMLGRVQSEDVVAVCYDDWNADEGYRHSLLETLGLPGRDLGRGSVQRYGGGSSFQGNQTATERLDTDARSAQMSQDLEYQLVLWTAARDRDFIIRLTEVFPKDAARLSGLLDTAKAEVTLP
ncbi:MAG: hypothetical protein AAF727_14740 [Pseudomonadota bacterium]